LTGRRRIKPPPSTARAMISLRGKGVLMERKERWIMRAVYYGSSSPWFIGKGRNLLS